MTNTPEHKKPKMDRVPEQATVSPRGILKKQTSALEDTLPAIHEFSESDGEELYKERLDTAKQLFQLLESNGVGIEQPERIQIAPLSDYQRKLRNTTNRGIIPNNRIKEVYGTIFYDKDEKLLFPQIHATLCREQIRFAVENEVLGKGITKIFNEKKNSATGAGLHTLGTMLMSKSFETFANGQYIIPGMMMINKHGEWCVLRVFVTVDSNNDRKVEFDLFPLDTATAHSIVVLNFIT
jgi:hypothetical protein